MAVVWRARDLRHSRPVAVKLLKPELLAGTGHGRFLREIGFLAELNHPNILPLFDSGEARDAATGVAVPYFTMPYVAGDTLRERLAAQTRLPLDEVVAIVRDVASGLDFAHAGRHRASRHQAGEHPAGARPRGGGRLRDRARGRCGAVVART